MENDTSPQKQDLETREQKLYLQQGSNLRPGGLAPEASALDHSAIQAKAVILRRNNGIVSL